MDWPRRRLRERFMKKFSVVVESSAGSPPTEVRSWASRVVRRGSGLRCASLAALALATQSAARPSPPDGIEWFQATALTFGWAVFEPSISADGRWVAFRSAYNFTGQNPDVNFEIFLYDRQQASVQQLTFTSTFFGNFEPRITPEGDAVVFRSLYNFTGGNADGSFELFEAAVPSGTITQRTSFPGNAILQTPRMSHDGSRMVFLSNFDGTMDVMRLDRATGVVVPVTSSAFGSSVTMPAVNGDGSVVAFRSSQNLDGSNPDGNPEVWRWVEGQGTKAVTQTTGVINELPSLDASGRYVAFFSHANLAGGNPNFGREIFVADVAPPGGGIAYVQATPAVPLGKHLEPIMSPDGRFVVFESDRDPVGENSDKNRELFRYDLVRARTTQLTHTNGGISIAGLSPQAAANYIGVALDGTHFVYRNEHQLDPGASDPEPQVNLEAFIASTVTLAPRFGDLDGDGVVGTADLAICLGGWGPVRPRSANAVADLDGDGWVGPADVSLLLGAWS
jgi:Tol biopolymer transport system component